ncbi:MAG: hypothetical protein A3E80_03385 [Chlamydiae bacterium RIFCSPHIGHO2_12_FULL_49_9]|nr:MAG: hypothetical protein A3E80_03385 [Chlamydiae bacterium RIFCSPHIGHO2_12_FULL_49_9]
MFEVIKKHWISIFSVLALGSFGVILYRACSGYYDCPSDGVAQIVGGSLGYAFLGFFVLNSLRKRFKKGKLEFWLLCCSVSFSLCTIYESVNLKKQKEILSKSKHEIAQIGQDLFGGTCVQEPCKNYSTDEYGDFAPILRLLQQTIAFSEEVSSELDHEIAGLENMLLPDKLSDYDHLVQSKEKLERFINKLNDSENKLNSGMSQVEMQINSAHFDKDTYKEAALKGFCEGRARSQGLIDEYYNVERSFASKAIRLIDFLSEFYGYYSVSAGKLIFQDEISAERYNQLFQEVIDLVQEEEAVVNQIEEHRQSVYQKWNSQ